MQLNGRDGREKKRKREEGGGHIEKRDIWRNKEEKEREEGGGKNKSNPRDNGDRSVFFVRHVRFFYRLSSGAAVRFSAMIIRLIIYSADKSDRQASNAMAAADLRVVPARRVDNLIKAR